MKQPILEAFAAKVTVEYNNVIYGAPKRQKQFDPMMIAAIIMAIIEIFKACKKDPDEVPEIAHNAGWFQKAVMRHHIRKTFKKKKLKSTKDERSILLNIALVEMAITSEDIVAQMYLEIEE